MLLEHFAHDLFAFFIRDLLSLLEEKVSFLLINNVELSREGVADIVVEEL